MKNTLLLIDYQNSFCSPDGELFVKGSIDDCKRISSFIVENAHRIDKIYATLDSHQPIQIFNREFFIDKSVQHPPLFTSICAEDINNKWYINPYMKKLFDYEKDLDRTVINYLHNLKKRKGIDLTIWPDHCIVGSKGFCFEDSVYNAMETHRKLTNQPYTIIQKGMAKLRETYSPFSDEIDLSEALLEEIFIQDNNLIIAGEAKSHCVLHSVMDIIDYAHRIGKKHRLSDVYLLEDCMSPVVTNILDTTEYTETVYKTFGQAGINRVDTKSVLSFI